MASMSLCKGLLAKDGYDQRVHYLVIVSTFVPDITYGAHSGYVEAVHCRCVVVL